MRRILGVLLALPVVACGSEKAREGGVYQCETCSRQAMGDPADDGQSTGLYKGILLGGGQTATLEFNVATDRSTGTAKVHLASGDVQSTSFVATPTGTDPTMSPYQYQFTGPALTLMATIEADGSVITQPTVTLGDTAMPPTAVVSKENSTTLVECFEGTWQAEAGTTTPDTMATSGGWNFVKIGPMLQGGFVPPMAVEGEAGMLTGTDDVGGVQFQTSNGGMASGTVEGDVASGTWMQESGGTATWSAQRKL
jgi:hypothetical protein